MVFFRFGWFTCECRCSFHFDVEMTEQESIDVKSWKKAIIFHRIIDSCLYWANGNNFVCESPKMVRNTFEEHENEGWINNFSFLMPLIKLTIFCSGKMWTGSYNLCIQCSLLELPAKGNEEIRWIEQMIDFLSSLIS